MNGCIGYVLLFNAGMVAGAIIALALVGIFAVLVKKIWSDEEE